MRKLNAARRLCVIQMMQDTQPDNDVGGAKSIIIPNCFHVARHECCLVSVVFIRSRDITRVNVETEVVH